MPAPTAWASVTTCQPGPMAVTRTVSPAAKNWRAFRSVWRSVAPAARLSQASQDPTFDQAKVDRIAQAIRDGNFSINPGAIADKLLANAQEVLGRSRPQH